MLGSVLVVWVLGEELEEVVGVVGGEFVRVAEGFVMGCADGLVLGAWGRMLVVGMG